MTLKTETDFLAFWVETSDRLIVAVSLQSITQIYCFDYLILYYEIL